MFHLHILALAFSFHVEKEKRNENRENYFSQATEIDAIRCCSATELYTTYSNSKV